MKRTLAAISFAILAVPAFAVQVSAPYEDTQNDRVLPNIQTKGERDSKATNTQSKTQSNPWANDYNFIAPAP